MAEQKVWSGCFFHWRSAPWQTRTNGRNARHAVCYLSRYFYGFCRNDGVMTLLWHGADVPQLKVHLYFGIQQKKKKPDIARTNASDCAPLFADLKVSQGIIYIDCGFNFKWILISILFIFENVNCKWNNCLNIQILIYLFLKIIYKMFFFVCR